MSIIFGLDFGTSNSALSANIDGEIKLIDIDRFNPLNKTMKSVIYFEPNEKRFLVGQQAVHYYLENDAYGRYIQSIKSFLPDLSFVSTEIGGRLYALNELIAIILRNIKERGEKYIGSEISKVVLGRPVIFSEDQESEKLAIDRLLSAARLAGFNEVYLQYEPIAAALAFESELPIGEERIVLIGDFGGGTSDFTIIKTKGGKHKKKIDHKDDILGLGGVYIGGDTFDSQLMWEKVAYHFGKNVKVKGVMSEQWFDMPPLVMAKLRKWHLIPFLRTPKIRRSISEAKYGANNKQLVENLEILVDDNCGYMLFQAIEKAKCELSSSIYAAIDFSESCLEIRENVNRNEFEDFIKTDVRKIELCIDDVIKQTGISYNDIDLVFLTGGSSYIPLIKRIFIKKFGLEKIHQANAFTSVAIGLGISGNLYV